MRKFYIFMLAMLCVASTAMAGRSVTDIKTTKAFQLRDAKTVVKKQAKTGLVKNNKATSTKANFSKLEGTKVIGMRKADATTTIEGTWTFDLGDFYTETSVGYTTYDFEAFLDGDEVWFEDPYGWELPFVAKFDKEANTLTFVRENLGTLSSIYVYQQPYIFSWDLYDLVYTESIVATYYPSEGVILFDEDNGLAWEACGDEAGTEFYGWYSVYDLVGATLAAEAEPIDEVQEGQWKPVGMAKFVDAWIMPSYAMGGIQIDPNDYAYDVELQQNVENENVYRLWKPYANSILAELNRSTYEGQIVFDISDPDHVMVIASGMPAGFKDNNGEFYLTNELGWWMNYYGGDYDKDSAIDKLYGSEPADTYKDGVVTITTPMFDFSNRYEGGYFWTSNPYYAVITFPEPEVETVGTYTMTIQPTTIAGEKTQPTVDIEIEVKKQGDNYWIAELGSTNYFNDQVIPFAYNDATKLATFTASYAGTFDEQHTWFSAFLNNGSGIELNENYPVIFNATTGFEWTGNSGFGWFITETAEEFAPMDVYSAFYVAAAGNEGNYADASIEGEWDFTLNGHYLGVYSLGEFTDKFTATLEGNTVTFISSTSQYNIVAEFTAENTLTFTKGAVNTPATYTLWQSPYVNTAGVEDLEELTEEVFTATYDAEAGTITFPANSGLLYGYFSEDGTLSYWDDAFDFVTASKSKGEATGIEGAKTEKAEVVYYDLNGRRIDSPKAGIYVKKVGNSVQKVVVK